MGCNVFVLVTVLIIVYKKKAKIFLILSVAKFVFTWQRYMSYFKYNCYKYILLHLLILLIVYKIELIHSSFLQNCFKTILPDSPHFTIITKLYCYTRLYFTIVAQLLQHSLKLTILTKQYGFIHIYLPNITKLYGYIRLHFTIVTYICCLDHIYFLNITELYWRCFTNFTEINTRLNFTKNIWYWFTHAVIRGISESISQTVNCENQANIIFEELDGAEESVALNLFSWQWCQENRLDCFRKTSTWLRAQNWYFPIKTIVIWPSSRFIWVAAYRPNFCCF